MLLRWLNGYLHEGGSLIPRPLPPDLLSLEPPVASSSIILTPYYITMEFRESKAAKHADYVFDSLLKAEALYDEGAYGDCIALLYNLIENYNMGPLPRMKTLVMLCVLHGDWEYAEACRLEAEDIWHHCDKHSEEGYDKAALANFAPLWTIWRKT